MALKPAKPHAHGDGTTPARSKTAVIPPTGEGVSSHLWAILGQVDWVRSIARVNFCQLELSIFSIICYLVWSRATFILFQVAKSPAPAAHFGPSGRS